MKILARFFSTLLHPLVMPLLGILLMLLLSPLVNLSQPVSLLIKGIVAFCTVVLPGTGILLLHKAGKISSVSLNIREERPVPYLFCIASYLLCAVILYKLNLPNWFIGFIIGGLLSLVVDFAVTFFWKISAHMTGMAGLLACALFVTQTFGSLPLWSIIALILLTGALGSSRIYLNRHTFGQVIAGTLNGFMCVYLSMHYLAT